MDEKKIVPVVLCVFLTALVIASCGCTTSTQSTKLTVFAGAGLSGAFNETAAAFSANHTGVNVTFNYAGSDTLATQLTRGAYADIFASADMNHMNVVKNAGLMNNSSIIVFAESNLAIVVPTANRANITNLSDLAKPGTKLVIGEDALPVGEYAQQMLNRTADNSAYGPSFRTAVLANVVSKETMVNNIVAKVALGEADAGIVHNSEVPAAYQRMVKIIPIPGTVNVLARFPIGVLSGSHNSQLAQSFINYVTSPAGQAILQKYGFVIPPSSNATAAAKTSTTAITLPMTTSPMTTALVTAIA